jgi:hypothetical protein
LGESVHFAFRHFPLTEIHPHALAASAASEAAALQGRFWEMHDLLFHEQKSLEDDDLRRYAEQLRLDLEVFERDRRGEAVLERVGRLPPARCGEPRPFSSTVRCTGEPTTQFRSWMRWHREARIPPDYSFNGFGVRSRKDDGRGGSAVKSRWLMAPRTAEVASTGWCKSDASNRLAWNLPVSGGARCPRRKRVSALD